MRVSKNELAPSFLSEKNSSDNFIIETYHPLTLEPGNYVLICFLPSPTNQGMPHLMPGMIGS